VNSFGLLLFVAPPQMVANIARLALARRARKAAQSLNRPWKRIGKAKVSIKGLC